VILKPILVACIGGVNADMFETVCGDIESICRGIGRQIASSDLLGSALSTDRRFDFWTSPVTPSSHFTHTCFFVDPCSRHASSK
jgi:hypothetical protein